LIRAPSTRITAPAGSTENRKVTVVAWGAVGGVSAGAGVLPLPGVAGGTASGGVAPAALPMGRHAADSVLCDLRDEPRRPFGYVDKGTLATIGRAAGVAELGRLHFGGLLAWLLWLFVHVYFLIGFRNRLAVILQWAWSYLTFGRAARLITYAPEEFRIASEAAASDGRGRGPPRAASESPPLRGPPPPHGPPPASGPGAGDPRG